MFKRLLYFMLWCVLRLYACFCPHHDIPRDGALYMRRWFLTLRAARVYREEGRTGEPGTYLQYFAAPDPEPEMHCHPWWYAESLILRGEYGEERAETPEKCGTPEVRGYIPGDRNRIWAWTWHRIFYVKPGTWTLFRSSERHRHGWGFMNEDGTATAVPKSREPLAGALPKNHPAVW